MMKSGTTVLIVDSVIDAVKFYTEKLAFDIAEMISDDSGRNVSYAQLRKGKCFIIFRTPHQDEMVEFSQIKHCIGRGVGVFAEIKKGIEKYFARCKSKGVKIVEELQTKPWGYKLFSLKDPFGTRLTIAQPIEGAKMPHSFVGFKVDISKSETDLLDDMIRYLKDFKITRRPAKKFAKLWLKKSKSPKKK